MKPLGTERPVTVQKHLAMQKRWKELHQEQRLRSDDCIQILKEEFFIVSDATIYRILATEYPAEQTTP